MPPSTMSSTSSVILLPDRPFGPSDQKPRRIGVVRPPRHNLPEGVHCLRPQGLKLTMPVAEPQEVRLVDRVQHLGHRALDNLVLERGNAEGSEATGAEG